MRISPTRLLRWSFLLSVVGLASCIAALIVFAGVSSTGEANIIDQKIIGSGDIYTRHDSESASDLASAVNSTVSYEATRTWDDEESSQKFTTSFIVFGAQSSGGYRNQYVVKSSGAGYKHVYRATAITGDFSGSGEITFSVGEDGAQNLDSLVIMDSRAGNATFQGRIYNVQTGKPITAEETDAAGRFIIESYLNVSQPIKTPEDWLGFCESLDKDVILDKTSPSGYYIIPDGYKLDDNGNLIPELPKIRNSS